MRPDLAAPSYVLLSATLQRKGDLAGAEAAVLEAARLEPKDAVAPFNLGSVRQARGDHAGAAASFRDVLRLNPTYPGASAQLGSSLYSLGDFRGAADALGRRGQAQAGRPDLLGAARLLAACDQRPRRLGRGVPRGGAARPLGPAQSLRPDGRPDRGGDPAGAVAAVRPYMAAHPDDAEARNDLGVRFMDDLRDNKAAAASFREAVRLKPDFALAQLNLGAALIRDKDFAAALTPTREAIRLAPSAEAYTNLAAILNSQGDRAGASAAMGQAIRLKFAPKKPAAPK